MNKDKQIEEMAKILVNGCREGNCEECEQSEGVLYPDCVPLFTANALYNAGYRKASEVAREIFEEADKIFMATCLSLETYKAWGELKKKYTGEDTNVLTNTEVGE